MTPSTPSDLRALTLGSIPAVGASGGWETWAGIIPPVTVFRDARLWYVQLSPVAVAVAERVACERQRRAAAVHRVERNRPIRRTFAAQLDDHRLGAYGEVAVAGGLGVTYNGPAHRPVRGPDIGNVHVKTRRLGFWDLIIQTDETDLDLPFLLCTGERMPGNLIILRGWIYGHEAPAPSDPYGTGRPARWIPQAQLRAVEALPGLITAAADVR